MKIGRISAILGALALGAFLAVGTTAHAAPNKCLSGKNKCVSKKAQGILKCEIKAIKDGAATDPACVLKARQKFDGALLVPPAPAKGCLEKLEGKQDPTKPETLCLTEDDTAAQESKVDAFVSDLLTELDPTNIATANKCVSGKIKCALKKFAAILKCHEKAAKDGAALDPECVSKARAKFDGSLLVPPNPAKGCFEKLEAKSEPGENLCTTFDDTSTIEAKVDAFVSDVLCELGYTTLVCAVCGNGMVEVGEDCDPPGGQCPNAATGILCSGTCQCACPGSVEFTGTSTTGVLDSGWTGLGHNATVVSDGPVTVDFTTCQGTSRPCGVCNYTGPIANAPGRMNNHRCTGNTRTTCNTNADCSVAGGTCEFYFGTNLSLSAGGVTTCVENHFSGGISGTANIENGQSAGVATNIARVFNGIANTHPCPRCLGDGPANDGTRGGTCDGGTDLGAICDVNGSSPNPLFGTTSLDCRPSSAANIANLTIDLTNTTGARTKTLTAASPNCRAGGHTTEKCFCDTCNNVNAEACSSNAECPDPPGPVGPICGGTRCKTGVNAGAPCSVNSECPGSVCEVPGQATQPNACNDFVCSPTTGNEGECSAGPTDFYCGPNGTMVPCTSQADCIAQGLKFCNGGGNANAVCTVASQCPGGTCDDEDCVVLVTRPCYTDNGTSGNAVTATGAPSVPVNDISDPKLASLFCIGPTAGAAVNLAAGLPGLGRLELTGHAIGKP